MARSRPFGTIRKLSSGRYQARYWWLGEQVSAGQTFATKVDARQWLSAMELDLVAGRHVDPRDGREPFGHYARRWLAVRDVRPRTRETYASQLVHILAGFEKVEIGNISPAMVRTWHGRLAASGLHRNTVAKVYRLFRTMMDTAVDDGLIRSNPVHIKGAAVEKVVERPILDWDVVARIAEAIEPRFEALVWVAAASGLRFGELGGLERRHIDLAARTIRVEQALAFVKGEGPTIGPPKSTSAHRTVRIPAQAVAHLSSHLDRYVEPRSDALVFTSVKGSPLLSRYFTPYWKRALEAAGIEGVRFHDLRHLAGTEAASAGASLKEVMARMGHASPDASLRYLKASESRDAEIADAIGRRMGGARSSDPE